MTNLYRAIAANCICFLIVSAVNLSALQINPLRTMIEVEAGKMATGSIVLTNSKAEAVNIAISLSGSSMRNAESEEIQWLNLEKDNLLIEPKQASVLNYEVLIPEGETGEFKARLCFTDVPLTEADGGGMLSISTKISVPFFAIVAGTEICDFESVDFKLLDNSSGLAEVTILNSGNIHVRPSGICSIMNGEGKLVRSAKVNKTCFPVFPGKERKFQVSFDEPLPLGKYVVELQLESATQVNHSIHQSFEFEVM